MPTLASHNDGPRLDYKARQAILAALRCQLAVWEKADEEMIGEDAFADMQNDILYVRGLLASLEAEFGGD